MFRSSQSSIFWDSRQILIRELLYNKKDDVFNPQWCRINIPIRTEKNSGTERITEPKQEQKPGGQRLNSVIYSWLSGHVVQWWEPQGTSALLGPCSLYPTWNLSGDGFPLHLTSLHECSTFMMLLTSWSFHGSFDIALHSCKHPLSSKCLQGSSSCNTLSGSTNHTQALLSNSSVGLLIP